MVAACLDARTATHGLHDSPAGLPAWLVERWKTWSDRHAKFEEVWPVDHILTNATIYWATQSIGSLMRAYKNAHFYPEPVEGWTHLVITVPVSCSLHLGDSASPGINTPEQYEALLGQIGAHIYADLRDVNVPYKGGHFGQWEHPDAWVNDPRQAFRSLR